jgi:ABC-type multidrug transport system fused ATPase/permease subunit
MMFFTGTLRSNLDPFGNHDDATLWDAVKRSHLLAVVEDEEDLKAKEGSIKGTEKLHRLTLDSTIEADGANLSVGQVNNTSIYRIL